jgi:predicted anti-sigma-YlaC factor YlaD
MSSEHESVRFLLGGYLLGGLDELDQRRADAHLRHCHLCRDEVELLAPVPEFLEALPTGAAVPAVRPAPPVHLENLLHRVRATRRRRARVPWLAAAAAIVVMLAVSVAFVLRSVEPGGTTVTFTAAAQSHAAGRAVLTGKPWGTSIAVRMNNLPATGLCVLQVVGRDGQVEQAATWGPTPTQAAQVTGGTSMPLRSVGAVNVLDQDGHLLATATVT